jgi:hypothetical protein
MAAIVDDLNGSDNLGPDLYDQKMSPRPQALLEFC